MKRFFLAAVDVVTCLVAGAQNADKLYKDGKKLYEAKNYTAAFPKLKAAAEKGTQEGAVSIGTMLC